MPLLRRALAPLLVLVLAVSACGSPTEGDGPADGDTLGSAAAPVTAATVASPDLSFDVTTVYVPVGVPVTFTYENTHEGVPHNLHVTGEGVDEMTAITAGPDTATLTVTFPAAGEYPYVCDVHLSMQGTVIAV